MPNSLPDSEESKSEVRLELARRLHDGTAQQLISLGYKLDEVIGSSDLSPSNRKLIRKARLELIEITEGLRDELYLLEQVSFDEAVAEIEVLLFNVEIEATLPKGRFERQIESTLAQITLEIARNARKHANPKRFWIRHSIEMGCDIFRIGSDGAGVVDMKQRSLGMKLISQQARLIGALIELNTSEDLFEYKITLNRNQN